MPTAPSPAAPSPSSPAKPPARRSIAGFFVRLIFGGKRAIVTVPLVLLTGYLGFQSAVFLWYRGSSTGTRTGVVIKVSQKGTPLCRYESVEMRVGQGPGMTVVNPETWEFTVDADHLWLVPKLEEAEKKEQSITVKYRQDTQHPEEKNPAPLNLPWRYCVTTSYHAIDVLQ